MMKTPHRSEHGAGGGDRPAHLHHHFDTEQQQFDSDKLGMWLFLTTEILLFGGLFCAYAVYRANHPEIFVYADRYLDRTLGGINTVILLCSSFTMAWAVRAAQLGQRRLLILLLSLTILGGFGFLGIKGVEYERKWKEGLLWGAHYGHPRAALMETSAAGTPPPGEAKAAQPAPGPGAQHSAAAPQAPVQPGAAAGGAATAGAPASPPRNPDAPLIKPAAPGPAGLARLPGRPGTPEQLEIEAEPKNVQLFFAIYFTMTGLHGLHVIAGMTVIFIMILLAARGRFDNGYFTPVDLTGLFWHLVDIVWIFLFPLLYLIH